LEANSAAHVFASTMPVASMRCASWNALTAPSVCGPKIPSAVICSSAWTAATASPVSPYESSAVAPWSVPTTTAFWAISALLTPGRAELAEATDATVSTGEARIAAPAASVAPFWRGALRRASRARMRRRRER
jgi:hypothetical protein